MKKILVVLTGGTIGSRVEGNIIDVTSRSPYRLISMYEEQYGKENVFEVISPLNILSENMTPDSLLILLQAMDRIHYEDYSGIIVTHGSDTLSYSAAYMGLLFHHLPIPVIMVASNYPLGQEGSNGLNNFARAVEVIREGKLRGVFVLYQDNKGINQLYLATRMLEADPFLDQFDDFSGQAFAKVEKGAVLCRKGKYQPSYEEVIGKCTRELEVPEQFTNRVLLIRPYPGLDYSMFDLSGKPAAILHYLYHSATCCTGAEQHNMLLFAERCQREGIDFYTASHKQTEGKRYATGERLLKSGARTLLNISPEAAYAKLMLIYNQKDTDKKKLLSESLYFEII